MKPSAPPDLQVELLIEQGSILKRPLSAAVARFLVEEADVALNGVNCTALKLALPAGVEVSCNVGLLTLGLGAAPPRTLIIIVPTMWGVMLKLTGEFSHTENGNLEGVPVTRLHLPVRPGACKTFQVPVAGRLGVRAA